MRPEEARQLLDRFAVAERLQHIRRFLWRGGHLRFYADASSAYYELELSRPETVLERVPANEPGLQAASTPVVEGRWVERERTHSLQVGVDLRRGHAGAIFIRAGKTSSLVPYQGRAPEDVEQALQIELAHVHPAVVVPVEIDDGR